MAAKRGMTYGPGGWAAAAIVLLAAVAGIAIWVLPEPAPVEPPPQRVAVPVAPPASLPVKPPVVLPAWRRYAVAAPVTDKPHVVVVIDDMGLDRQRSARAMALPAPVTLSYLPYGEHVAADATAARARGHELLLHLPMEPVSRSEDPGPHALYVDSTAAELNRRIDWNLSRFEGYVGINNHMGSRFTADRQAMVKMLGVVAARGLMWLDSRTTGASVAAKVAVAESVPFVARDVFLDDDPSPAGVAAQLQAVEALARRKGIAVAIGHPRDATLAALEQWLPSLPAKGLALAPLTAAIRYDEVGG